MTFIKFIGAIICVIFSFVHYSLGAAAADTGNIAGVLWHGPITLLYVLGTIWNGNDVIKKL